MLSNALLNQQSDLTGAISALYLCVQGWVYWLLAGHQAAQGAVCN